MTYEIWGALQCYETSDSDCAKYPSNTYIQDVWFNKCVSVYDRPSAVLILIMVFSLGHPTRSISGTSSGKEKAFVASLSCSPDGRCSNVNVNDINVV